MPNLKSVALNVWELLAFNAQKLSRTCQQQHENKLKKAFLFTESIFDLIQFD